MIKKWISIKPHPLVNHIVNLAIAISICVTWPVVAQNIPPTIQSETPASWKDLGFEQAPDGYPTDSVTLFVRLNRSRGGWTFKGSHSKSDETNQFAGRIDILGSFKQGMFPSWNLVLAWPIEIPKHVVNYNIMALPDASGFKLMLARLGPTKPETRSKAQRALFRGKWSLENQTIVWTRVSKPAFLHGLSSELEEFSDISESFEMVIANNGGITIQYPEQERNKLQITGNAIARIGGEYIENPTLQKTNFNSSAEVSDPRVKRCLPPSARNITLHKERGGHFAKYEVSKGNFHEFLNSLWKAEKDKSAHRREEMHGEGKPAKQEKLSKRFQRLGWPRLKSAIIYYSPSKANGAMTTYYFNHEAGIAYHDTGYW